METDRADLAIIAAQCGNLESDAPMSAE